MRTFEQRISEEVIKVTSKVVVIFLITITILFSSILLVTRVLDKRINVTNMETFINDIYGNNKFVIENIKDIVEENSTLDLQLVVERFNTVNYQSTYNSSLIIVDKHGEIIHSTFPTYQINDHMNMFIRYYLASIKDDIDFRSYNYSKDVSYLMSGARISNEYFVLLLQNKDMLTQHMIKNEVNGVIVDKYDRIVTSSNIVFEKNTNKKFSVSDEVYNGENYESRLVNLDGINLNGYYLSKVDDSYMILGIIIIALIAFYSIVYFFLKKSINDIAKRQLQSLNILLSDIQIVTEKNIEHKLSTNSNDEFAIIAKQVNTMNDKIRFLTENNTELIFRSQISELKHLEAQFNPHFLYNTLDTIRLTSGIDPTITENIILKLTKILRYSIDNTENTVLLKNDIEYIKMYCELQKIRFGKNFEYKLSVAEECSNVEVPKLILQPLIENSIKNSFNTKATAFVEVKIYMQDHFMVLEVSDDGDGIEDIKLSELTESLYDDRQMDNHHGLFNTYRRIKLIYGNKCTIHIKSKVLKGTKVSIIIDLKGKAENNV